ncbi:hypothetical protein, partial [Priestia megaterium]|uniref:hypothetical protein n=1 Tax=Priestia megaterium TaxID=1404 RepID=UPI0035B5B29C
RGMGLFCTCGEGLTTAEARITAMENTADISFHATEELFNVNKHGGWLGDKVAGLDGRCVIALIDSAVLAPTSASDLLQAQLLQYRDLALKHH